MKELNQHIKSDIKVSVQKDQKKEQKNILIGQIKPNDGHTLFKVNKETGEVSKAQFRAKNVSYIKAIKGDFSELKDLVIEEGFVYIPALNKENAAKCFNRNPNQEAYYKKEGVMKL